MSGPTPWQRRFRKLALFAGTLSSLYLLANYTLDRLREARVRALKDREIKDRLRSHFTSLLSTVSFTLYALLPTLQPQLLERYPVENTSQALQGMSVTSSTASLQPEAAATPGNSLQLNRGEPEAGSSTSTSVTSQEQPHSGVGESWASEFQRRDEETQGAPPSERDDLLSSTTSQSISLPATDLSSDSASPPSNLSSSAMLSPSPPRRRSPPASSKSKKELWRDLKVQSISKCLTTAYLVPLLLLLTSAQLSTLARVRYLKDVKRSLPPVSGAGATQAAAEEEQEEEDDTPVQQVKRTRGNWLNYFSVEAMGLADFVDEQTTKTPLSTLTEYLPAFLQPGRNRHHEREAVDHLADDEEERAEAERLFLTYSWWLLHEGWKGVADRVDAAVERVFAEMPLKRELSPEDWLSAIKEARALIETDEHGQRLHDFTTHILPPYPMSRVPHGCPLPTHPETSPYLTDLLGQTRQQLSSPDGRHLLDKGVSEIIRNVIESLRAEIYTTDDLQTVPSRRLVDCLPEFNRWAKGIWEGVPDSGVEGLLSLPDFESFAALIFGDWA